jgi:hypothetical protein
MLVCSVGRRLAAAAEFKLKFGDRRRLPATARPVGVPLWTASSNAREDSTLTRPATVLDKDDQLAVQVLHRVVVGHNSPCLRDIAGYDEPAHIGRVGDVRHSGEVAEGATGTAGWVVAYGRPWRRCLASPPVR